MPDSFVFFEKGDFSAALPKLQCNILRSTGHPRSTQIFRRFAERAAFAKWFAEAPSPSSAADDGEPAVNVLFTMKGLELLGVSANTHAGIDEAFKFGSRDPRTRAKLDDREELRTWREHEEDWHVVELHHGKELVLAPRETEDYVVEHGTGVRQDGTLVTQRHETSYGHFGIRDGISKPVYTQADYAELLRSREGDSWLWDPRRNLSTLIVPDFLAPQSPDAYGSYFVFRKYKQDRAKFDGRLEAIAREIERRRSIAHREGILSPELRGFKAFEGKRDGELLEAIKQWIFGRGTNGETAFGTAENNFNFSGDAEGRHCPFHAHISKMDPRGRTGNPEFEKTKTLARRGTSYVRTLAHRANAETQSRDEAGLLFWCAQASIGGQFEYVQKKWANGSEVDVNLNPTPGVDGVIGRLDRRLSEATPGGVSHWKRWTEVSDLDANVWDAVELVGAEYLYAPSIDGFAALKQLASRPIPGEQP